MSPALSFFICVSGGIGIRFDFGEVVANAKPKEGIFSAVEFCNLTRNIFAGSILASHNFFNMGLSNGV